MRCPVCKQGLRTIPPCYGEWMCINEDCPINGRELYGVKQKDITQFCRDMGHLKSKDVASK